MTHKRTPYAIRETAPSWAKKTVRILQKRGQSRLDLAELWECSVPTVSRRLGGQMSVVAEDMRKLAAFLDVDFESLLADAETSPEPAVASVLVRPMVHLLSPQDDELLVDDDLLDREPTSEELELLVARASQAIDPTDRIWPPMPVGERAFAARVWGTSGLPEFSPDDVIVVDPDRDPPISGDLVLFQAAEASRPIIGRFVEMRRRRMIRPIEDGQWPTINVPENPAILLKILAKLKLY